MSRLASREDASSSVERCVSAIRGMVLTGVLLPGEKLNQLELATQLEVSRVPVREALTRLQSDGFVVYRANTGWTVSRFNSDELAQLYLMRQLMETELLRTVDLGAVDVERMRELLERMQHISPVESPEEYQQVNMDFHFAVFDTSPLRLVREEARRLWFMSAFYRSLYIHAPETSRRLHNEHERMIAAVKARNVARLIQISDQHRAGTQRMIEQRLGPPRHAS
jgi:DNA-binding GntR family transcriptional regulator